MGSPNEPEINSLCDFCGHKFGIHFSSFDGNRNGCLVDDQRDGRCSCKGFGFIYRPRIRAFSYTDPRPRMTEEEKTRAYYDK
jgi:hypothetical protein